MVPQFFSSTFNKGDRVVLLTAGGDTIVSGVVEAINLLNTTVRTDLGAPVSIPNKVQPLCTCTPACLCSGRQV